MYNAHIAGKRVDENSAITIKDVLAGHPYFDALLYYRFCCRDAMYLQVMSVTKGRA